MRLQTVHSKPQDLHRRDQEIPDQAASDGMHFASSSLEALTIRAPGEEVSMPKKETIERARKDKRQGKAPSTQAGEFVREEIEHVREGKHGARSAKQAIAIGLSKARRAGVKLPPPKPGRTSRRTREGAERDYETGQGRRKPKKPSARRRRAVSRALEHEPRGTTSRRALARQARAGARRRTAGERSASARKAARTKGPKVRAAAARKAARTRARRSR